MIRRGTVNVVRTGTTRWAPAARPTVQMELTDLYLTLVLDELASPSPELKKTFPVSLNLSDVIGCHRLKGPSVDDIFGYFSVFEYPLIRGRCLKNRKSRQRRLHTFQVTLRREKEANWEEANVWVQTIRSLVTPLTLYPSIAGAARRLYVLVNPRSGAGRALAAFSQTALPLFAEANLVCKVLVTERSNQAAQVVQSLDLSEFDGIVIASGDGLVYEVLNGLLHRSDRDSAIQKPIGILPCGSGNALAVSALYQSGEPLIKSEFMREAGLMVARPTALLPMNLVHVETPTQNIVSFLSVSWGLLADIDIESEKYRKSLGSGRFAAGAVIRVLGLRTYRGRLSYLPVEDWELKSERRNGYGANVEPPTFYRTTSETEFVAENGGAWTEAHWKSGSLVDLRSFAKRRSTSPFCNDVPISHDGSLNQPLQMEFSESGRGLGEAEGSETVVEALRRRHVTPSVPPLGLPPPATWRVLDEEFVFVMAAYLSHLGPDIPYIPDCRLEDDVIYLTMIRASRVNRMGLAKFILSISTVDHLKNPDFEVIPVRAFRIEPQTTDGVIAVDGEALPSQPIQVVMTSYQATVMGRQPVTSL